jgi:hypothetical protein
LFISHISVMQFVFNYQAPHMVWTNNSKQEITPWIHIKQKVLEKETKFIYLFIFWNSIRPLPDTLGAAKVQASGVFMSQQS